MAQSGYTPILIYASGTATNVPLAANMTSSASGAELALNYVDGKLYYKDSGGVVQILASKAGNINVSSFSAGTTGLTPNTATTGAVTLAGTLITSNGGTGLSSYTAGDLSYYASGTALTKLAIGTNGYILQSTGSAPSWVAASTVVGGAAGSNTQVQFNNSGALGASANLTWNGSTLAVTGTLTSSGNVGAGTTTTNYPLSFSGNNSTYQATGTQMGFGSSGFSGYGPHIGTTNRTYVHFIGSGGGSVLNTWIHGYQVGNPAGSNYIRVAPGISGNPVSGLSIANDGVKWYYNASKTTGDPDYTPTLYHTLDSTGLTVSGLINIAGANWLQFGGANTLYSSSGVGFFLQAPDVSTTPLTIRGSGGANWATFSSTGLGVGTTTTTLGSINLAGSAALGITSGTTGDYLSSGGGNNSTYNGIAIISNSRGIGTQANSSLPSWIVDIGGRGADGSTFPVTTANKFRVAYAAAGTSFYSGKDAFSVDSSLRIGFGTQGTTTDRLIDASFQGATTTGANQFGIVLNPTYPNTVTSSLFNFYTGANLSSGATLTSAYGVYVEAGNYSGSTVTNKYGIYQAGAADRNYFAGQVGINNTNPTTRLAVTLANNEAASMTSISAGTGAVGQNQGEIRELGFNVNSSANFVISSIVTTSSGWRVVFRGTWSNNYEGGGLTTYAPYIELNAANPSTPIGSRTLTVSRNGSGYLIVNSTDSYYIAFAGTVEIYENPQSQQPQQSMRLLGGIQFPATANLSSNVNTLDDYEEGTFTPQVAFGGSSTGMTYSYTNGQYRKIGSMVYFWITVYINVKGSGTGSFECYGLPFIGTNSYYNEQMVTCGEFNSVSFPGSALNARVNYSSAQSQVSAVGLFSYYASGAGQYGMQNTNFTNGSSFAFAGCYTTNQ
jgi:hypothetical protein